MKNIKDQVYKALCGVTDNVSDAYPRSWAEDVTILNMLDDIPPLSVMLTIIQAAMEPWEHGMSYTKVQNLYDYWADKEGGNQTDLYSKVIIPTLAVSGFFTQEQADVLVEEMQNV